MEDELRVTINNISDDIYIYDVESNEFIEKNIVDASTIMPERVSLISKMIFHETPSTVYTSLKQLKGLSHDTFSGVFLAFTNIFKIAGFMFYSCF